MVLAMPVFHPTLPSHTLLRPGFELDAHSIARLTELRVNFVWIQYPALESVVKYAHPTLPVEHAAITSVVGRALDHLRRARDVRYAELDFRPYVQAVRDLCSKISQAEGALVMLHDLVSGESDLAMHSGNVCFLSILLGLKLDQYLIAQRKRMQPASARSIDNLGVSALLHDIGVTRLDPRVYEEYVYTGDDTLPAYQAHVRLSYDMLRRRVEATAAAAVLQHHQRYDGHGYPKLRPSENGPRPLRGEEIHVFARIIAVADRYDRLRNPPRGHYFEEFRTPVVSVLKQMQQEARVGVIDPIVFKGLLHVVPAFAPGTVVKLSSNRYAIVSDFNPLFPCCPTVRLLNLPPGKAPRTIEPEDIGEAVDLRHAPTLRVVQAEGHDVSRDFFDAGDPAEFDLRYLTPPAPHAKKPSPKAA